jgi:hypothetical protein
MRVVVHKRHAYCKQGTAATDFRGMTHRLLQQCSCGSVAGDVLRGATCTNFVYPTKALFGAVPPERHVVSQCLPLQCCRLGT